jgi:hypothetical protein
MGSVVYFEPSGINFSKPVTVKLFYREKSNYGLPEGPSEARAAVHKLMNSSNSSSWRECESTFDGQTYLVSGLTNSFSTYGLLQVQMPASRLRATGPDVFSDNMRTAIIIGIILGCVLALILAGIYVYPSIICWPWCKTEEKVPVFVIFQARGAGMLCFMLHDGSFLYAYIDMQTLWGVRLSETPCIAPLCCCRLVTI